MKKNAILVAGIMAVATAANVKAESGSEHHTFRSSDATVQGSEDLRRTPNQEAIAPTPVEPGQSSASHSYSGDSEFSSTSDSIILGEDDQHFHEVQSSRDDFGQGSSDDFKSDKAGSLRGSANWNQSDDLLIDGVLPTGEYNNDASVGGAARAESGSDRSESMKSSESESPLRTDLNASEKLEQNISGNFDLEDSSLQKNDSEMSATSSITSSDIIHSESNRGVARDSDLSSDMDASGSAASSESGTSSSSNDEGLRSTSSPLGTTGGEPNWQYKNNPAHGVGSLATGEFGSASERMNRTSDQELARQVKERLIQESTGTHGLMRHEVAKGVNVSAKDGKVILKGTVPAEKDKRLVEIRAREIANVQNVDNQLVVSPKSESSSPSLNAGHDLESTSNQPRD